jgi:hypothetical protein
MWTDKQMKLLIKERKKNNNKYHDLVWNGRMNFWKGDASKINLKFGKGYSGKHSMEKFQSLIRFYNKVSKMVYYY